jgi:DNA replication protein DnaC
VFKSNELKLRRASWLKLAHIPPHLTGWELDDCKAIGEEDMTDVKSWVASLKNKEVIRAQGSSLCGSGLMFYGTPGKGKTTLALAIIQEIIRTFNMEELDVKSGNTLVRPCFFTTFNEILNIKGSIIGGSATDDQEVIYNGIMGVCEQDSFNIRVLVIDDIGKEHASLSGWQKNLLHEVLRTRFNNGLPTIVTTNIKLEDWAALYGDATESFANEAFVYIPIISDKGDLRK